MRTVRRRGLLLVRPEALRSSRRPPVAQEWAVPGPMPSQQAPGAEYNSGEPEGRRARVARRRDQNRWCPHPGLVGTSTAAGDLCHGLLILALSPAKAPADCI